MITLDQVILLEKKVESAVEKIQQLQAENDALRSKCSELTNALSAKAEQLSTLETDKDKIECSIKNALDRLNSIENSVLKSSGQVASSTPLHQNPVENQSVQEQKPVVQMQQPVQTMQSAQVSQPVQTAPVETVQTNTQEVPSFDSMNTVESQFEETIPDPEFEEQEAEFPENTSKDGLGFDIW